MRYFELTDYYDITTSSFVEPKNLSKKEIIEFLKDAEDEIVELINSTLNRNRDELISYIRNVKIKLEPEKVIKSKYSISYTEAIKPILDNPARYPKRFADDLKRLIDRNNENDCDFNLKKAIEGLLDEYDREDTLDDETFEIFNALAFSEGPIGFKTAYSLAICYATGCGCKKNIDTAHYL